MAHCSGRGDELFVGDIAHITIWEQGGVAQVILFYYIISVTLLLFILLNRTSLTREIFVKTWTEILYLHAA